MAEAVACGGLTVLLSSHLLADLERVADHLILLATSRVQLCGDIDALLAEHQILVGPRRATTAIEKTRTVVQAVRTARQTTLLVRGNAPVVDPGWESAEVGLEEMVLAYMRPGAARVRTAVSAHLAPHHGWRRPMTWLVWRQHRAQFSVGAALLAALAVLLLITGLQMASQYHSAVAACTASHSCANLASSLFLGSHAVGFLVIMTLGAPVLVGLFWGAPLVAAELETGTSQFAWMQSVTRKRWLAVKAGWLLLAAAVWGGVISALVTWWSGPDNALQLDQFKPGRFDIMGIVPVAYALFAMALGICAGALLRRTLPALAVTLAGFIAVRAAITLWLRPHYLSAITATHTVLTGYTPPGSSWQLAQGVLLPARRPGRQPRTEPRFTTSPSVSSRLPARARPGALVSIGPSCRACPGRLPFVRHLPARRPLLGVPGDRDRHLRRARRHRCWP